MLYVFPSATVKFLAWFKAISITIG